MRAASSPNASARCCGAASEGANVDKELGNLLPWHVNGTLTGADSDRVEKALRTDPKAVTARNWELATQRAVKTDPGLDVPSDYLLQRTLARVRESLPPAEVAPSPQLAPAPAAQKGRGAATAEAGWLGWFTRGFQWSPALAVACGLVVVQFAVMSQIWPLHGEEGAYALQRAAAARAANSVYLRVAFKPDTTEAELRESIRLAQGEIVAGPSQLGEYYLMVAKADAPGALASLQNRQGVEAVELVDALPARQ